eukprot:1941941-Prymnesium_polylepis.1
MDTAPSSSRCAPGRLAASSESAGAPGGGDSAPARSSVVASAPCSATSSLLTSWLRSSSCTRLAVASRLESS